MLNAIPTHADGVHVCLPKDASNSLCTW